VESIIGSLDETLAYPREIFRAAVASRAYAVVLMHNHPSGSATPSSADTTEALLAGKKAVTRRDWPDSHARKFPPGKIAIAYDRQPMYGGRPVARIQIVSIKRESLNELYADPSHARTELRREGDLWRDVDEFVALFSKAKHGDPYRIEFRLVECLI
jgi:hypothetical protein